MDARDIINFWFDEIDSKAWWKKDPDFDALIRRRFLSVHEAAARGELYSWREQPSGRLAEVIVLDQFSRNLYRDAPQAFAFDGMALVLSQEAVALGVDAAIPVAQRAFMYMPYMHSESPLIHEQAMSLFAESGMENNYQFELKHKAIIDRFGRYPHRNAILGRESTTEELEFLQGPGSSF